VSKTVAFFVALVLLFGAAFFLPIADWAVLAFTWIDENRTISWLVFIALYIVATVLLLPGSLLTLGAGYLFGLGYGFAMVSFASVVGASCAFLVGRFFARQWVAKKLGNMPRFAALDRAIEQRGALIVLLTRLSPIFPFNLLNYALGLTGVRFWTYVAVSWVGMIPGTMLYVYLGSIASNLTSLLSGDLGASPAGQWPLYVGLLATLILTIVISRIATKTLTENLEAAAVTNTVEES
jgi:uncharacterized membrane protein YdjX (TVP38/TMEM64 family)